MMKLYDDKTPINSIDKMIPKYEGKIGSPTCTLLPLLSLVKHNQAMMNSIVGELGMPENFNLHLD